MRIQVLIPAYNEKDNIFNVVREVKKNGYDVLVVDDGSIDNTSLIAESAGAHVLSHIINRGQGAAIKTGIEKSLSDGYDIVVFFDADGQMKAEEISSLIEPLIMGKYDVVLGSRFLGKAEGLHFSKLITLKLALLFTNTLTGLRLTDVHNGFQAWSSGALRKLDLVQDRMAYASELLNEIKKKDLRYKEIPVTIIYKEYGQSIFNSFNILWDLFIKK